MRGIPAILLVLASLPSFGGHIINDHYSGPGSELPCQTVMLAWQSVDISTFGKVHLTIPAVWIPARAKYVQAALAKLDRNFSRLKTGEDYQTSLAQFSSPGIDGEFERFVAALATMPERLRENAALFRETAEAGLDAGPRTIMGNSSGIEHLDRKSALAQLSVDAGVSVEVAEKITGILFRHLRPIDPGYLGIVDYLMGRYERFTGAFGALSLYGSPAELAELFAIYQRPLLTPWGRLPVEAFSFCDSYNPGMLPVLEFREQAKRTLQFMVLRATKYAAGRNFYSPGLVNPSDRKAAMIEGSLRIWSITPALKAALQDEALLAGIVEILDFADDAAKEKFIQLVREP